jgi:8-oxo-dGTP pyrophosphatase MutT (NUDIX family)
MQSSDKFYIEKSEEKKEVASVAVVHDGKILMMQRRDNERWTLPGGHLDEKEKPAEGAKRELKEEAGIEAPSVKKLGSKEVKTFTGKQMKIHAFIYEPKEKPKFTAKNDPDREAKLYKWVDMENFPEDIKHNLHSPRNVVLQKLGILKSMMLGVSDLFKSKTHKYIRKYKRNNKWVYIYKEPKGRTRNVSEEDINDLKKLAELGDEKAKFLIENMKEYNQKDIEDLRLLHSLRDEIATRKLKEMGIDPDIEELKESMQRDFVNQELTEDQKNKVSEIISASIKSNIFDYLNNHRTASPFGRKLVENVGEDFGAALTSTMEAIKSKNTLEGMLKEYHKQLMRIENGMPSANTSSNSSAKNAGGYGNLAYKRSIENLISVNILPATYDQVHRRDMNNPEIEVQPVSGIAERVERERRERVEREARQRAEKEEALRREIAELDGSMAMFAATLVKGASLEEKKNYALSLDRAIKNIFGRRLTEAEFPYKFDGIRTEINSIEVYSDKIYLKMTAYDQDGNQITDRWDRTINKVGGRPHIHNNYLVIKSDARNGARLSDKINSSQRNLMRSIPEGGTITVMAALSVGPYTWCNNGFSFESSGELQSRRSKFKAFLSRHGINLTDDQLEAFKEPFHFAAFTNGSKHIIGIERPIPLTQAQKDTRSLSGVTGEHPLTQQEISSGKSSRMAVHLGKKFMLESGSWDGVWDSKKDTEASRYAESYSQMRERAVEALGGDYAEMVRRVQAGEVGQRPQKKQTSRTSSGTSPPSGVGDLIRAWETTTGRYNRRRVRMTPQRVERIARLSQSEFDEFIRTAPITFSARSELRQKRRELGL